MRVVNQNYETITEYDLKKGYLIPCDAIREDAIPIDDIKKFAWADKDWEKAQMYVPYPEKTTAEKISECKAQLAKSDYKIIKCMEYSLIGATLPYNIAEVNAERQALRDKINELEGEMYED